MALSSGAAHGISAQWGDLERSFRPLIGALTRCRRELESVTGLTSWTGPASDATKTVVRDLIAAINEAIQGLQALVDEAVTQREYWTDMGNKIHKSTILNIVFAVVGGLLTLTTFFMGPIGAVLGRMAGAVVQSVSKVLVQVVRSLPGVATAGGRSSLAGVLVSGSRVVSEVARTPVVTAIAHGGRAVSTVARGRWAGAGKETGVVMETVYSTGIDYTISFAVDASIRRITEAVTGIKANYALSAILAVGGVVGNVAFGASKVVSPKFRDFLLRNPMVEDVAAPPVIGTIATPTALGLATTIVDLDVDAGAYYLGIGGAFIAGAGNVAARRGFGLTNRYLDTKYQHTPNIGDYFHGPVRGVVRGTTHRFGPDGQPLPPVRSGIGDLERQAKDNLRSLRDAEAEVRQAERGLAAAERSTGSVPHITGIGATGDRTRERADHEESQAAQALRRREEYLRRSRDPNLTQAQRNLAARSAASANTAATNLRRHAATLRTTAAQQDRSIRDAEGRLARARGEANAAQSRVDRDRANESLIDEQIEYLRRSIPFTEMWFRIFGQVGSRVGSRGVAGLISDIFTPQPTERPPVDAPGQVYVPDPLVLAGSTTCPTGSTCADDIVPVPVVGGGEVGAELNGLQIDLREVGNDLNQLEQGINTALARLDAAEIDDAPAWELKQRLEAFRSEVTALQGRITLTQGELNAGGTVPLALVTEYVATVRDVHAGVAVLALEVDLAWPLQAVR